MTGTEGFDPVVSAAECLGALKYLRRDESCRHCDCLDWALAELQQADDPAVADEAASLRAAPERLHAASSCRQCPPLDAVLAWLTSGRHIAGL